MSVIRKQTIGGLSLLMVLTIKSDHWQQAAGSNGNNVVAGDVPKHSMVYRLAEYWSGHCFYQVDNMYW